MTDFERYELRFENFLKALRTLKQAALSYGKLNELERDGLIQRFEFTFELAWKCMQDYLKFDGFVGISGPRSCIVQMAQKEWLDPFIWQEMMDARNTFSHQYDESKSTALSEKIVFDFLPALDLFASQMSTQNG